MQRSTAALATLRENFNLATTIDQEVLGLTGAIWKRRFAAKFMDKIDTFGGHLALHHRFAFHLMYEILGLDAEHFRRSYITTLMKVVNGCDAKLLSDPAIAEAFADMSAECFAQGSEPLVKDAELLYRQWDFDVTRIARPVHMWQGIADHLVPYLINKEISDRSARRTSARRTSAGRTSAMRTLGERT